MTKYVRWCETCMERRSPRQVECPDCGEETERISHDELFSRRLAEGFGTLAED